MTVGAAPALGAFGGALRWAIRSRSSACNRASLTRCSTVPSSAMAQPKNLRSDACKIAKAFRPGNMRSATLDSIKREAELCAPSTGDTDAQWEISGQHNVRQRRGNSAQKLHSSKPDGTLYRTRQPHTRIRSNRPGMPSVTDRQLLSRYAS